MWTATRIKTAPTVEPLYLDDVKAHIRIESTYTAEDDYIESLITVAREHVESITGRKLINQTWYAYYDGWPECEDYITLPFAPVVSVTAVTYTDSGNLAHTWPITNYDVDINSEPCRITLGYGDSWPSDTLANRNPVRVEFIAGYGSSGSKVPFPILQAMKIIVSDLYEQRESNIIGRSVHVTRAVDNLLSSYRMFHF